MARLYNAKIAKALHKYALQDQDIMMSDPVGIAIKLNHFQHFFVKKSETKTAHESHPGKTSASQIGLEIEITSEMTRATRR